MKECPRCGEDLVTMKRLINRPDHYLYVGDALVCLQCQEMVGVTELEEPIKVKKNGQSGDPLFIIDEEESN